MWVNSQDVVVITFVEKKQLKELTSCFAHSKSSQLSALLFVSGMLVLREVTHPHTQLCVHVDLHHLMNTRLSKHTSAAVTAVRRKESLLSLTIGLGQQVLTRMCSWGVTLVSCLFIHAYYYIFLLLSCFIFHCVIYHCFLFLHFQWIILTLKV